MKRTVQKKLAERKRNIYNSLCYIENLIAEIKDSVMEITRNEADGGVILTIRGSLSGTQNSTVQLFETISIEVGKKPEKIVLDLEEVVFVDSMSIGMLIGSLLKCRENKIEFCMENVPMHVKKILDSTNLKKLFPDLY